MAYKTQSNEGSSTMHAKRLVAPISPLESRGSRMLKAALNNKTITPLKDRGSTTIDEHPNVISIQQVARNRKRSPKNCVLFREPVVSQEYSYEPTYIDEPNEQPAHKTSDKPQEEVLQQQKQANDNRQTASKETERSLATQSYEFGDVDDDGDLFTMASSDVSDFSDAESKRQANGATKRLHKSLEDDAQDDFKKTSRNESGAGGLFSSPKVAKIAPYFDERPHEKRFAEAKTINKNRLRALQQRSLCTRRYTIKRNDSVLSQSRGPLNALDNDRVTDLTLSSYKKFSSPQICRKLEPTALPAPPAEESNCKSEANGYFSWIATFITHQMNKLIF